MDCEGSLQLKPEAPSFAAYIPCYEEGNSVKAIKKDGETLLIEKGIKQVITGLLKESSISIKFLRKNFGQFIGRTNLIPLPLSLGTVFIPVKVRKSIGATDGAYGYMDLSQMEGVLKEECTVIKLCCGIKVECLESVKTIRDRMKEGRLIGEKFASLMLGECGLKEGINTVRSEYERAATRGDITMLAYEIMKLRCRLEQGKL